MDPASARDAVGVVNHDLATSAFDQIAMGELLRVNGAEGAVNGFAEHAHRPLAAAGNDMGSDHEWGSTAGSETMGEAGSDRRCKQVAKRNTCSLH